MGLALKAGDETAVKSDQLALERVHSFSDISD